MGIGGMSMVWKMIAVSLLALVLSTADADESTGSGRFPVVDGHAHIGGSFKWATIIDAMDKKRRVKTNRDGARLPRQR